MPAPQLFATLGLTAEDIEILTWDDINMLPEGPPENGQGPTQIDPRVVALGWKKPYLHVYSHDYFQGSQHIESRTRIWADGTVEGFFQYHNDSLMGFCGGIGVAMLDENNLMIHSSSPPSGCINGKDGGQEKTREVAWGDQVPNAVLPKIRRVISKAYPTAKNDLTLTREEIAALLKVAIGAVVGGGGS